MNFFIVQVFTLIKIQTSCKPEYKIDIDNMTWMVLAQKISS